MSCVPARFRNTPSFCFYEVRCVRVTVTHAGRVCPQLELEEQRSGLACSLPAFPPCVFLQEGSCPVVPPGSSLIGQRRTCRRGCARKGCRTSSAPSAPTTSTEQSSAGSARKRRRSWESVRPKTHHAVTRVSSRLQGCGIFHLCGFHVRSRSPICRLQ